MTVDNPLAQSWRGTAFTGGSVALRFGPGPRLEGVEVVGYVGVGGRQQEIHARLDPEDPADAEALSAWRRDPGSRASLRALGHAAAGRAALDVRDFAVTRTAHEHGGQVAALGHALGLTYGSESVVSALTAQRSRPSGGEWEERADCVST